MCFHSLYVTIEKGSLPVGFAFAYFSKGIGNLQEILTFPYGRLTPELAAYLRQLLHELNYQHWLKATHPQTEEHMVATLSNNTRQPITRGGG